MVLQVRDDGSATIEKFSDTLSRSVPKAAEEATAATGGWSDSMRGAFDGLKELSKGIAEVNPMAGGLVRSTAELGEKLFALGGGSGPLAAVVAGCELVGGAMRMMKDAFDWVTESSLKALEFKHQAEAVGMATKELSMLTQGLEEIGMSSGTVTTAMRMMAMRLKEVTENGGVATGAYAKLGVQMLDGNGKMKSQAELLASVADKFKGLEDGAGKTQLAMQLFGRGGAQMVTVLNEGGEAIRAMQGDVGNLILATTDAGAAMGLRVVKAQDQIGDAVDIVKKFFRSGLQPAVIESLEAIGSAADTAWKNLWPDKATFDSDLKTLQEGLKSLVPILNDVASAAIKATSWVASLAKRGLLQVSEAYSWAGAMDEWAANQGQADETAMALANRRRTGGSALPFEPGQGGSSLAKTAEEQFGVEVFKGKDKSVQTGIPELSAQAEKLGEVQILYGKVSKLDDEYRKQVLETDTALAKAQTDLDVSRATEAQQLAMKRISSNKSVFDAEMELASLRENADNNLTLKIIQNETEIERKIQGRVQMNETLEQRATLAVIDAQTQLDRAREDWYIKDATRVERRYVAEQQWINQIRGMDEDIDILKDKLNNSYMIREEARKNVDKEHTQSQIDQIANEAKANYAKEKGYDISKSTQDCTAKITDNVGKAADGCGRFASNMGSVARNAADALVGMQAMADAMAAIDSGNQANRAAGMPVRSDYPSGVAGDQAWNAAWQSEKDSRDMIAGAKAQQQKLRDWQSLMGGGATATPTDAASAAVSSALGSTVSVTQGTAGGGPVTPLYGYVNPSSYSPSEINDNRGWWPAGTPLDANGRPIVTVGTPIAPEARSNVTWSSGTPGTTVSLDRATIQAIAAAIAANPPNVTLDGRSLVQSATTYINAASKTGALQISAQAVVQ